MAGKKSHDKNDYLGLYNENIGNKIVRESSSQQQNNVRRSA